MRRLGVASLIGLGLAAASPGFAQQTEAYFYDVHGRLQAMTRAPANAGSRTRYALDAADNRDSRVVENSATRAANDWLGSGEALLPSQRLISTDNRFTFLFQATDGNLVVYGPTGPLWASSTTIGRSTVLVMQPDGDLVLRGPDNQALWQAGTSGHAGAQLIMQNDGNLVIYAGGTPVWATGTGGH